MLSIFSCMFCHLCISSCKVAVWVFCLFLVGYLFCIDFFSMLYILDASCLLDSCFIFLTVCSLSSFPNDVFCHTGISACVSTQSCPTLWDLMDCGQLRSSVHGIFQARILDRVAISYSIRSSCHRDWTRVSCLAGRFFTTEPPGKPLWNAEFSILVKYSLSNFFVSLNDYCPLLSDMQCLEEHDFYILFLELSPSLFLCLCLCVSLLLPPPLSLVISSEIKSLLSSTLFWLP